MTRVLRCLKPVDLYTNNKHRETVTQKSDLRDRVRRVFRSLYAATVGRYPYSRKSVVTAFLLIFMYLGLTQLGRPYNQAVFGLGTLLLSTDYKVLRTVSLSGVYRAVAKPGIVNRAEKRYRRKQFIEGGQDKIRLIPQEDGNFRGTVSEGTEYVREGLEFLLYVEAPIGGGHAPSGVNRYDLRLGSIEITNVSNTSGKRDVVTVFFSISNWEHSFEDRKERQLANEVRERFSRVQGTGKQGNEAGGMAPFAKMDQRGEVNDFSLDEWCAISQWVESELED